MNAEINVPLLESIFYKNSPLHDGATIIKENFITATRVVLPFLKSHFPIGLVFAIERPLELQNERMQFALLSQKKQGRFL